MDVGTCVLEGGSALTSAHGATGPGAGSGGRDHGWSEVVVRCWWCEFHPGCDWPSCAALSLPLGDLVPGALQGSSAGCHQGLGYLDRRSRCGPSTWPGHHMGPVLAQSPSGLPQIWPRCPRADQASLCPRVPRALCLCLSLQGPGFLPWVPRLLRQGPSAGSAAAGHVLGQGGGALGLPSPACCPGRYTGSGVLPARATSAELDAGLTARKHPCPRGAPSVPTLMCTVTAGLSRGHPLPLSAHQRGRAAPRPGRAAGMRRTSRPHRLPFSPGEQRPQKVVSGGRLIGSQAATGAALPFPRSPRGPSASLGALSAWDLRESVGPPSAPPTKRHCRSLSEPEELARCRSPWRPGGSKVWTPVPKRRCHSGGSATLLGGPGTGSAGSAGSPPKPRPASASARSGLPDPGPARLLAGPCTLSPRRRLSLSQEHLAEGAAGPPSPASMPASTPASTPELGRRPGLLRCRSQPCVRAGGPGRRKRRLEEDARWPRPALDFLKMTRVRPLSRRGWLWAGGEGAGLPSSSSSGGRG